MAYDDIYTAIRAAQSGDRAAQEHLVASNTGLVWSIVRKFTGRGHEADDLFQVGCIGLLKAIEKFDTSFEVKFSTYAVPMILGEIKRFLRDDGMIKVSRSLKELAIKGRAAADRLSKELGREPSVSEIAQRLEVAPEELVMAMDATAVPESINSTPGEDGRELGWTLADGRDTEGETIDRIAIQDALATLDKRERQIILMRYFQCKTQAQIAALLGISQVQVSRIEKRVLNEMRNKMTG